MDILGIKLKKELYHFLLDIEKKIEGLYFELMSCDRKETLSEREKVVKNIKTLTVTKRVLFLNMTHQLSYDEYYDLALYGDFYELSSNMPIKVDFSLVDDAFNEEEFFDNLIFRTLFVVDNSFSFNYHLFFLHFKIGYSYSIFQIFYNPFV